MARLLSLGSAVALLSLLLVACGPRETPRVADYRTLGELRVATRQDAISYRVDENGQASGFEHDLLLALADSLEVPVDCSSPALAR